MKLTLITVFALIASVMAQNNTVIPNNNGMAGTAATASISVAGDKSKSAGNQLNGGIIAITLTSAATAAYALL